MGYVAVKGGGRAIAGAAAVSEFHRTEEGLDSPSARPLEAGALMGQLRLLVDRIVSEGGVYHPLFAALALKQSLGDTLEAAFALRAWRSTRPRLCESPVHGTGGMRLIRRISSAFKDVAGGQMLGPTRDYALKLLRIDLLDESPEAFRAVAKAWLDGKAEPDLPVTFPKVLDHLRREGLLQSPEPQGSKGPFDITREPLVFPVPRSAALATMARGETGALLSLAYSTMRGYGDVHPTLAELRVGWLPVRLPHPVTGEAVEVGEVMMTECEIVAMYQPAASGAKPVFTLGYGACFGHNEVKAISMAVLDRSLQKGAQDGVRYPAEDPEFVLSHCDGVDSMGFTSHWKLPHYVTFQSTLDRLRTTRAKAGGDQ